MKGIFLFLNLILLIGLCKSQGKYLRENVLSHIQKTKITHKEYKNFKLFITKYIKNIKLLRFDSHFG